MVEDVLGRVDREEIAMVFKKAREISASYFAVFEPDRRRLTAGFLAAHSVLDAVRDFDPMFGRFA